MTKRELRKKAQDKIVEGKSRQQVFEEMKAEHATRIAEIVKIVRFMPSLATREKYKTYHILLLTFLGISIALKIVAVLPMIIEHGINWLPVLLLLPVINLLLIIMVASYNGQAYKLVAILSFIGVVRSLGELGKVAFDPWMLVGFGLAGALIGLGFFMHSKMVSEYQLVSESYTTAEGKEGVRKVYKFPD